MPLRSIRLRLTFWSALTLTAIMAVSGLAWHFTLSSSSLKHIDDRLELIAVDVAAYHHTEHIEPIPTDDCQRLEGFLRSHNWGEFVQILNERGSISCASSNLEGFHLPLSKEALQHLGNGEATYETIDSNQGFAVRLLTLPVIKGGHLFDIIQVGQDLSPMEKTLSAVRLKQALFIPAAVILFSLGGWFLAGRALAPVDRITRAVQKINAENLDQRLPLSKSSDEISRLTETFNSMLSRLKEQFHKMKQFSGDASHELRTPLTILRGETEVALRWAKEPDEFREILRSNMEEIDRMERIIENLLTLAKNEELKRNLELQELSLSDLLQELYLSGNILGEKNEVSVRLNLEVETEVTLRGDELRLRQLFLNLISNAVKYTSSGGTVTIGLTCTDDAAVITVTDTGVGIAPEHLALIFDRFYRVDKARNRNDGGSGLGLAIAKWVVDAHEGTIHVASIPDEGSTFTVSLPLAGPAEQNRDVFI